MGHNRAGVRRKQRIKRSLKEQRKSTNLQMAMAYFETLIQGRIATEYLAGIKMDASKRRKIKEALDLGKQLRDEIVMADGNLIGYDRMDRYSQTIATIAT